MIEGKLNDKDSSSSKGANYNDISRNGRSPIIWASEEAHVNVVELSLFKGANPYVKDDDVDSIIWVYINGHLDVV